MDAAQLAEVMEQRWSALRHLLEISDRQLAAIDAGQMTQLMRLLSEKQQPLNRLAEIAEQIRGAAGDDPASRKWESEERRADCRRQQEECEKMHLELLAIEAECESALKKSREAIQQNLERVDSARQAANGYLAPAPTSGSRLDLSE
jgi:hypothetical protein